MKDGEGSAGAASGSAASASVQGGPDAAGVSSAGRLERALFLQGAEIRGRYAARRPAQTLDFFSLEPGMTVVEVTPEGGWYSRILYHYLSSEGVLVGADYPLSLYRLFDYYSEDELAAKEVWSTTWPVEVLTWGEGGAADTPAVDAFNLGSLPERVQGKADAVLFIRALHSLQAYESTGGYLGAAIADAFAALKPGGIVGVVQHMGPESASDAWANGDNGYLKKSAVIRAFEQAGFVLDAESDHNENPLDMPGEDDYVWRLPPTLEDAEDPVLKARYEAIGESNRMTLRFKKPPSSS
ncbi:MAG: class I SAM-dependent methyltransferase [Congregibacter sp.]